MQANGAQRHRITAGRGDSLFASWSPGGKWIVFSDLGSSLQRTPSLVRTTGLG